MCSHTYIYIYTHIYIFICLYMHSYQYIYMYLHINIFMYTYIYIHIHIYIFIYIGIHVHIYTYVYMNKYIHIYAYMYIRIYVYICIYIYIYASARADLGVSAVVLCWQYGRFSCANPGKYETWHESFKRVKCLIYMSQVFFMIHITFRFARRLGAFYFANLWKYGFLHASFMAYFYVWNDTFM